MKKCTEMRPIAEKAANRMMAPPMEFDGDNVEEG